MNDVNTQRLNKRAEEIRKDLANAGDPSPFVTIVTWAAVTLFLALLALFTAPLGSFFGGSLLAVVGAVHGLLATLGLLVGTVTSYLGWRLFTGKIKAFSDLKILSVISTFIAAATIIFGNWIYIAYRAPGGPREFFLQNNPAIHNIFFEFKEFIALFPLPLAVAATFVIWHYGERLIEDKSLRTWVGIVFAVAWSTLIITYVLGAGITKLRSV
jgi:hypothetical protein